MRLSGQRIRNRYCQFTPEDVEYVVRQYVGTVRWEDCGELQGHLNDSNLSDGGKVSIGISPSQSPLEQRITLFHEIFHLIFDWFYDFPVNVQPYRRKLRQLGRGFKQRDQEKEARYFTLFARLEFIEEWFVEEEAWRFYFAHRAYADALFLELLHNGGG